ncbi:MAG: 4-amino-4-deoxychorismate lyase [Actinobacteria bacterium]|nr:4-amino-4-deoxychorismate lyase [Actinomycetota bacterium]
MDISGVSWVNGSLIEPGQRAILPNDHSVIVGDGVFETLQVYEGRPFALARHLKRLKKSSEGLGLLPPDKKKIKEAIDAVLHADPEAGLIRITWSSGSGVLGSARGNNPGTLIVATQGRKVWPPSESIHIVPWPRNERGALTGLKTTSYAENVLALERAHQRECDEALFLNTRGLLCEGTGTNIFLVINAELVTPPLSSGCLAGITRELVLEITEVVERNITPEELSDCSEAFLTSSTRDLSPVSRFDDLVLPFCPGPTTKKIGQAFSELKSSQSDP